MGTVGISLQNVTIVVICIYSCYLQLFLYLFLFTVEINLFMLFLLKNFIFIVNSCIYFIFIGIIVIFKRFVNQYMYLNL